MSTSPLEPGDRPPAPAPEAVLPPIQVLGTRLRCAIDALQRALDGIGEDDVNKSYMQTQIWRSMDYSYLALRTVSNLVIAGVGDDEDEDDIDTPLLPESEEILAEIEHSFKKTGGL